MVASKADTEGALLGSMIALVLEREGIPVETRLQLGPTQRVRKALLQGEIDIYPEYTGNGAFFMASKANRPGKRRPRLTNWSSAWMPSGTGWPGSSGLPPTTPG